MKKRKKPFVDRRDFLKGAAAGAAALAINPRAAVKAEPAPPPAPGAAPIMSMAAEVATPPTMDVLTEDRSGSDHMVDVLKFNAVDGTYIEHCFCHVSH